MTTIGRPVWFRFVRQTAAIGRIFLLATPFIEGLLTDVAPAQTSPAALRKRASKVTASGGPVHTFHSLLRDLATCTLNEMTTTLNDAYSFTVVATPTPIQAQAFSLLAVDPTKL